MSGHRCEIQTHAGPSRMSLVGGGAMLLVRVRLFDAPGCQHPRPDAWTDLQPSQARRLAFELLSVAEHAEHHSQQAGIERRTEARFSLGREPARWPPPVTRRSSRKAAWLDVPLA